MPRGGRGIGRRSSAWSRCQALDPNRSGQCAFDEVAARLGADVRRDARHQRSRDPRRGRRARTEPIFVVGWSQLVRDPFIATASRAVYGMHPTLLPRHRGRHDSLGDPQRPCPHGGDPLRDHRSYGRFRPHRRSAGGADRARRDRDDAVRRAHEAHLDLIRAWYRSSWRGPHPACRRMPAVRALAEAQPLDGIIDWETRAHYLHDWVRAQTRPYPGAFTWLGDEKVVVWGPPLRLRQSSGWDVVACGPEGPVVACGEGGLLLGRSRPRRRSRSERGSGDACSRHRSAPRR